MARSPLKVFKDRANELTNKKRLLEDDQKQLRHKKVKNTINFALQQRIL